MHPKNLKALKERLVPGFKLQLWYSQSWGYLDRPWEYVMGSRAGWCRSAKNNTLLCLNLDGAAWRQVVISDRGFQVYHMDTTFVDLPSEVRTLEDGTQEVVLKKLKRTVRTLDREFLCDWSQ